MNRSSLTESLDELLGRFCGALESERDSVWTAGDIVDRALDDTRRNASNPRESRRAQAAMLRQFASAGHCTTARCRQLAAVSGTFGTEQRHVDIPWTYFRAVLNAAKRTKQDARALLDEAIAKAMTVADLNALGVEPKATAELREQCGDCGARVHVEIPQNGGRCFVGLSLACPLCAALAKHDGGDMREAATLGVMG